MFAINHAATALIFKRRFEDVSLVALLLSVQAMEFAWVALTRCRRTSDPTATKTCHVRNASLVLAS